MLKEEKMVEKEDALWSDEQEDGEEESAERVRWRIVGDRGGGGGGAVGEGVREH